MYSIRGCICKVLLARQCCAAIRRRPAPQELLNLRRGDDQFVRVYDCRVVLARGHKGLAEEQPAAYKDVDLVVEVVHQAGISRKVARLRPVGRDDLRPGQGGGRDSGGRFDGESDQGGFQTGGGRVAAAHHLAQRGQSLAVGGGAQLRPAADEVARPEYRHAEPSPFLDDLAERIATICVPPCTCAASAGEGRPALALFTEDGHMRPFADIESEIIRVAVDRYDGRISEIARRLQIGRSTVYRKIEEFGIRPDRTAAGA